MKEKIWQSPMIEKLRCYHYDAEMNLLEPNVEINMIIWINGYWSQSEESRYYCQKCSKYGFNVEPKVEGQ